MTHLTHLTHDQRRLARSALGLNSGNETRLSYRNRFLAAGANLKIWQDMARAGLARSGLVTELGTWFHLTRAGAQAALDEGERLCPEDFPPLPPPTAAAARQAALRRIEDRMMSGDPFTLSDLNAGLTDSAFGADRLERLADHTVQKWRKDGLIVSHREGRRILWQLTDAGRARAKDASRERAA